MHTNQVLLHVKDHTIRYGTITYTMGAYFYGTLNLVKKSLISTWLERCTRKARYVERYSVIINNETCKSLSISDVVTVYHDR